MYPEIIQKHSVPCSNMGRLLVMGVGPNNVKNFVLTYLLQKVFCHRFSRQRFASSMKHLVCDSFCLFHLHPLCFLTYSTTWSFIPLCSFSTAALTICYVLCSVTQLHLTLWDRMDCSLPGSSVHRISQVSVLEELPFPAPWDPPDVGIEPMSLCLLHWQVGSSPLHYLRSPQFTTNLKDTHWYLTVLSFKS